ncbi:MAG: O-antigen polymerase, partial [Candidatus Bathyarchaeia archaeon]
GLERGIIFPGLVFLSIMALGPFIIRLGYVNLLHPIYWVCATFFFHICVRGWLIALQWKPLQLSSIYLSYSDAVALLPEALLLSGVGLLLFYLGYFAGFGKAFGVRLRSKIPLRLRPSARAVKWLFALWILGWAFHIASVQSGASAFWLNVIKSANSQYNYAVIGPLDLLARLCKVSFVALTAFYFLRRKKQARLPLLLIFMVLVEAGFGVFSGLKQYILQTFLMFLLAYNISGWKGRQNIIKWGLALVLLLLFSGILVVSFRAYALHLGPEAGTLAILVQALSGMGESLGSVIDALGNRLVLDNLLLTLAYVPDPIPYAYGGTFLPKILFSFIPQFIWPERNRVWSRDLFWELQGPYVGGTAPTLVGDLYFNFGILGVLLGMFLIGLLLRFIYEALCARNEGWLGGRIILAVLLVTWFDITGGGLIHLLFPLVRDLPIALLVIWLVNRLSSHASRYSSE